MSVEKEGSQKTRKDPQDESVAALRDELLARFAAWLDETLADELPPAGIEAEIFAEITGSSPGEADREGEPDLFSLWSSMIGLTQEVKLQGRAFGQLRDSLTGVAAIPAVVDTALTGHQEALATASEIARTLGVQHQQWRREAEQEGAHLARQEGIEGLIDVRDRLRRGQQTASEHLHTARRTLESSWLLRTFSGTSQEVLSATSALQEGYALGLLRLEQMLSEAGVTEIECLGLSFDPVRMRAVALRDEGNHPDGQVLEVVRSGYEWNGRVFRPAEVCVARGGSGGFAALPNKSERE